MIANNYGLTKPNNKIDDKFSGLELDTEINPRYKWHQLIHTLITELNITEKKVYKMKYLSVLTWLGYFKNRDEVLDNIRNKK